MKLHGFAMSPNTKRAILGLEEAGLTYERVPVDLMSGEHRGAPYRELNPTARVPTLVDGDFVLWESNAILEYAAALAPAKRLGGETARERGEVARWMYMNTAHLSPNMARVFAHTIRLPEAQRNPKLVEESRAEIDRCLVALEQRLAGREWVAADRLTIADLSVAPTLGAAGMLQVDLTKYPNVVGWMARIEARPSWGAAHR
jgi:glutathione S-transferase